MKITKKLTAKLRSEWLKALESGRFKQTKGRLMGGASGGGVGYCCLGVACKVFEEVTGEKIKKLDNGFILSFDQTLEDAPSVIEAFGFKGDEGEFNSDIEVGDADYASLASMNDGGPGRPKLTFKQIAEAVRKNPKKVFVS